MRQFIWVTVSLLLGARAAAEPAATHLYWTDRTAGAIFRVALAGGAPELVVGGLPGPLGLDVDGLRGKVYWADTTELSVRRANLDGTGLETIVAGGIVPTGIGLDGPASLVYWTDPAQGLIQRAPMDGGPIEDLVSGQLGAQDVEVDRGSGRVYWTVGPSGVFSSDLSGAGVAPLLDPFTGSVDVFAVDAVRCRLVWEAASMVTQASPDGLCVLDLAMVADDVRGLAVGGDGTIYWSDAAGGRIRRLAPGSAIPEDLVTGLPEPYRLALGPELSSPTITEQPSSMVGAVGGVATMHVGAVGSEPLSFQWTWNGQPLADGGRVSGAASPTLELSDLEPIDTGVYACEVTSAAGSEVSASAVLGVPPCTPPGPAAWGAVEPCGVDLDGDCDTDVFDFADFTLSFGDWVVPGAAGDVNCDGHVNVLDFAELAGSFGCGSPGP